MTSRTDPYLRWWPHFLGWERAPSALSQVGGTGVEPAWVIVILPPGAELSATRTGWCQTQRTGPSGSLVPSPGLTRKRVKQHTQQVTARTWPRLTPRPSASIRSAATRRAAIDARRTHQGGRLLLMPRGRSCHWFSPHVQAIAHVVVRRTGLRECGAHELAVIWVGNKMPEETTEDAQVVSKT